MKILLFADYFPPAFAPRMGYLVKYLVPIGYHFDIITSCDLKEKNFKSLVGINKIIRVSLEQDIIPKGPINRFLRLLLLKRKLFIKKKPFIQAALQLQNNYDLILVSTSWDMFVLSAAAEVSEKWKIPYVVDLRDIHEQNPEVPNPYIGVKKLLFSYFNNILENAILMERNRLLKTAGSVITVSPFHVEQLSRYNNKTSCIYNGFNNELFHKMTPFKSNIFSIVYTGSINSLELRNPEILFLTVAKLKNEKLISPSELKIAFYIPSYDHSLIKNMACFLNISEYVEFNEYLSADSIPLLLNSSSILLVLSNISNKIGPKGVLTTKFFEYLGVEKPVLCVRSDESILEEMIKKSNAGVAARTVEEAYDFIREKFEEWKEKGYTTVQVNQKYKKQFSRKEQAIQFAGIFESVIKNPE